MSDKKMTPGVFLAYLRENQNNNKTLKAIFTNQFLTRMSMEELEGFKKGINKEINRRSKEVIDDRIAFLEQHGYKVQKD
jgi:hypothetical protein